VIIDRESNMSKLIKIIYFCRHLQSSRLEIIKETGHAVNIEAPTTLNNFITSFVLSA